VSVWSILVPLIPTLLGLIANILGSARDKNLIQAGIDQEIARQSERISELTETGRKMRERIEKLNDPELNDLLRELGAL
jgi:hypothetical protein